MQKSSKLGVVVKPKERLSQNQVKIIDETSRELLINPGILCHNKEAMELFKGAGAQVEEESKCWRVSLSESIVDRALDSAPEQIVLGARDPDNTIKLDAKEPRVHFGSGSETNVWLETEEENGKHVFKSSKGNLERLSTAAHLGEYLDNLDFFIRCVNIQDPDITVKNKDVNVFACSLNNITKHVMGGLASEDSLPELIKLGETIAGSKDAFNRAPLMSFITCIVKSPLQLVDDTTTKHLAIARRGLPVVVSTSPMGGTTAPFEEFGMVAQINAEILAAVTLNQLAAPGAPVFYGSVPVRSRLDNLADMYGAPEFVHYNQDCAQMARYYGIPCYSTAGVADARVPGIQATAEKMLTITTVPRAGAHFIHYALGLLDRTNIFSPEQAILDDAHIGMVKAGLREPDISTTQKDDILAMIREVFQSSHKTYIYHLPQPSKEDVYIRYPLENGDSLSVAREKYREICKREQKNLDKNVRAQIEEQISGIIPAAWSKPAPWLG